MKPQSSGPSEADKEREILLKQFRAYLHLAITAKQTGQDKQLEAMPGPRIQDYCRVLAKTTGQHAGRGIIESGGGYPRPNHRCLNGV